MSRRELIEELSERAFTTRKQTGSIIESLIEIVSREAVNGFSIPGLCKFQIVDRKARRGRNPRTGEPLDIPAAKSLKIRPLGRVKHSATAWIPEVDTGPSDEPDEKTPETEESFFIRCPHCERRLEADTTMVGMHAECPYCEESMIVPQNEETSEIEAPGTHEYIYFYCPTCKQAIEAPDEDSGKSMKCPTCKASVLIPAATELSQDVEETSKREMLGNTIRIDIP